MLQSIQVVDETHNQQFHVGMHPEDHVVPHTSSKIFPSLH